MLVIIILMITLFLSLLFHFFYTLFYNLVYYLLKKKIFINNLLNKIQILKKKYKLSKLNQINLIKINLIIFFNLSLNTPT
jgi:hypothetical protein